MLSVTFSSLFTFSHNYSVFFFFQVQFVITFTHSLQTYVSGCDFPLWGQYLLMSYMIVMLILFGNFYLQSYIYKRGASSHPKKTDKSLGHTTEQNGSVEKNGKSHYQNGSNIVANGHSNGAVHRH